MSLITEDGTGRADAESLASVDEADGYFSVRGPGVAGTWSGMGTDEKESALRQATEYLQRWTGKWKGARSFGVQALDWPRTGVVLDGVTLSGGAVPVQVKRAVFELALKAVSSPLMSDETAQVKSESVGPVAVTYADGARQQTRYAYVEALLAPLLSGSGSIKVVRA